MEFDRKNTTICPIESSWQVVLESEFAKEYYLDLLHFLDFEHKTKSIYPPKKLIFNSLNLCDFEKTKIIILGQDPYHGQSQAHGLSFSVQNGVPFPPSLRNIFKELHTDLGLIPPLNGNLEKWALQGVLLLNSCLTVESKQPNSHQNKGWEQFTDAIISTLSSRKTNLVFVLWGAFAQKKAGLIDANKHFILESPHPSPFSAHRGFFGSKPFSQINAYLQTKGLDSIDWELNP